MHLLKVFNFWGVFYSGIVKSAIYIAKNSFKPKI